MAEESPHLAFRTAYRFVHSYLDQVDRLLSDFTDLMAREPSVWRRLRPQGESYMGELDLKPSGNWMPDYAFAFYAPADAFPSGKSYGVPASAVPRVALVGAVLAPAASEGLPELNIGWVENYSDAGNGTVESRLAGVFEHLDPQILEEDAARVIVESIENLKWNPPCPVSGADPGYEKIRVSLRRARLSLIQSRGQLEKVVAVFRQALARGSSAPI